MYIDTHCHLSKEYYDDIDQVVKENKKAGVNPIIISGCDKKGIIESLEIASSCDSIYVSIGYHPDTVMEIEEDDIDLLEEQIKNNKKVVAIGEIGLDYHYGKENKNEQIILFEKQLALAQKLDLPVVIHSREAVEDTINCLKKYNVRGIIHCFSGSLEVANIYIKMGFKLGIGGVITFKNSKLGEVVSKLNIKDIVLETDSPYLAPVPFRGSINTSKNIPVIAKKVSEVMGISLEQVEKNTNDNVFDIFYLNDVN